MIFNWMIRYVKSYVLVLLFLLPQKDSGMFLNDIVIRIVLFIIL